MPALTSVENLEATPNSLLRSPHLYHTMTELNELLFRSVISGYPVLLCMDTSGSSIGQTRALEDLELPEDDLVSYALAALFGRL